MNRAIIFDVVQLASASAILAAGLWASVRRGAAIAVGAGLIACRSRNLLLRRRG
jgi:hypothetical protein